MNKNSEDFINKCPFADLLGIKKEEELTEAQKIGLIILAILVDIAIKKLLEIAKQHKTK